MTQNLMAATALNPQVVVATQVAAATTETAVYTVPAGSSLKVATASVCNISGSAVTVNVSVVPSGSSASTANRIINGYVLAPNDTLPLTNYVGGALLGPGDFISVNVSAATAINFTATGAVGS